MKTHEKHKKGKQSAAENKLSREQILDIAEATGRKMGVLIAIAPLANEIKEALVQMLLFLTPKQIDEFIEVLEERFLEAHGMAYEGMVRRELNRIEFETERDCYRLNKKTDQRLAKIEEKIQSLNPNLPKTSGTPPLSA